MKTLVLPSSNKVVSSEKEIIDAVDSIIAPQGSYAMWIIHVTDDPKRCWGVAEAIMLHSWCAETPQIAKRIKEYFVAKGMLAISSDKNHHIGNYVCIF